MNETWLLLIYTVPAEPSRKRAAIWRELKRAGAVYLRDGVAALPADEGTLAVLRGTAARVVEFGGRATLVEGVRLDPESAAAITVEANAARAAEYAEIGREAARFLAHVAREREHRALTFAELEEIEADLGKLRRWTAQVQARDRFGADGRDEVNDLLDRCDAALASFLEETYRATDGGGA